MPTLITQDPVKVVHLPQLPEGAKKKRILELLQGVLERSVALKNINSDNITIAGLYIEELNRRTTLEAGIEYILESFGGEEQ